MITFEEIEKCYQKLSDFVNALSEQERTARSITTIKQVEAHSLAQLLLLKIAIYTNERNRNGC
jgi:predicted membrane protein